MAKRKSNDRKAVRKPPKADKPTKGAKRQFAAVDADQQQATFFRHKRALAPLLAAERAAKADVAKAFELAKAEGVSKKDLLLAFRLDTDEGEADTKLELQAMLRVAAWVGASIGTQGDLFGTKTDKHFEEGKRQALQGGIRKPPPHIAHDNARQWFDGFDAGSAAMNAVESVGRGEQAKRDFLETIG